MMQSGRDKLRGYVIFNRHGHRAPSRNIMRGEDLAIEAELWRSYVLREDSMNTSPIAIKQHPANGIARDLITHPFGCITMRGREHLRNTGRGISHRFPALRDVKVENLSVYSTNYQRTQASAQMIISGLYTPDTPVGQSPGKVEVQVRDMTECSMSFYDGFPLLAKKFFIRAQSTEVHKERENRPHIIQARDVLSRSLPGLLVSSKDKALDPTFDWLGAFDYYACREGHDMPLHAEAGPLSQLVRKHLAERYSGYYRDPVHLAHAAVPLLVDLERSISSTDTLGEVSVFRPTSTELPDNLTVKLYSGHDITVLALLYALKADIIEESDGFFWPDYGSTVIFEIKEGEGTTDAGGDNRIATVYLDLSPLAVNMRDPTLSTPDTPSSSFTLSELRNRIAFHSKNLLPKEC